MNTNISTLFFIRRRSIESVLEPQVFQVEDGRVTKTEPTVTTMADSVKPLLTSMKLFGLYFKSQRKTSSKVANKKSRCRWNGYKIYSLVVIILFWITMVCMFSVFIFLLYLFCLLLCDAMYVHLNKWFLLLCTARNLLRVNRKKF